MKKIGLIVIICLASSLYAMSQSTGATFMTKARDTANKLRYNTEELLKIDNGHDDSGDLVRIKGFYYMPLYNFNLYKGKESTTYQQECLDIFKKEYPYAEVQSISIPQTDWIHENVKKKRKIVGYLETLYCYIIAKDGKDGYINARFSYKQYKDVGDVYGPLVENWPKFERVDFLIPEIYNKLLTK